MKGRALAAKKKKISKLSRTEEFNMRFARQGKAAHKLLEEQMANASQLQVNDKDSHPIKIPKPSIKQRILAWILRCLTR